MTLSIDKTLRKAQNHIKAGELTEAEELYKQVLSSFPKNKKAIQGYQKLKELYYKENFLNCDPPQKQAQELLNLFKKGLFDETIKEAEILSYQFPKSTGVLNVLAAANLANGNLESSLINYQKVLKINPKSADVHNNIGIIYRRQNKFECALDHFKKSISIDCDFIDSIYNIARIFSEQGEVDLAILHYQKCIRINSNFIPAYRGLSLLKRFNGTEKEIDQMIRLFHSENLSYYEKQQISFSLGKVYNDISDFKNSFYFFAQGNRIKNINSQYKLENDGKRFQAIKKLFQDHPRVHNINMLDKNMRDKRIIFLVGLPRSGTSLVEQILSSHSSVHGAGELELLRNSIIHLDISNEELSHKNFVNLRSSYLKGIENLCVSEDVITDKANLNFQWIGFILTALPESKIIHIKRDPIATCWSIFKHDFLGEGLDFGNNIRDLTQYYKMYQDLMKFWHTQFPQKIFDLDYESLTVNPEAEIRNLLSYVDLDWETQCLAPNKNDRFVGTASNLQVKQNIYTGSSQKWKNYEPYLQEMISKLRSA
jgi:tetratricopeptide (TPR) repeat protein